MKIYNTNDAFGHAGPFEAESFEALADEMMPTIKTWAEEKLDRFDDAVAHGEADADDRPQLSDIIDRIRDEFIDGLEEMPSPQDRVNSAADLDELCSTLNAVAGELGDESTIDQVVDTPFLPTFGGVDPHYTSGVWSWDHDRILVADGSLWAIEDRCECGEATFHCRCGK